MDSNLSRSYIHNVTLWMVGDANPTTYIGESYFNDSSIPYTVVFGGALEALNVTVVDSSMVVEGDKWVILISACGATNPLPPGASATLVSQDGTSTVTQLTLDRGFEGAIAGGHDVYRVNQHFTVRAPGTEVQSITVANKGAYTTWTNGAPSYSLTFNESNHTACLAYDTEDWELEVGVTCDLFVQLSMNSTIEHCTGCAWCSTAFNSCFLCAGLELSLNLVRVYGCQAFGNFHLLLPVTKSGLTDERFHRRNYYRL